MGIYFRNILFIRISRGANNCVQRVFETNIYFIMIFPPILNSYYPIGSHITLQPKTGCPLKLSRVEPGQYLDGRPPGKTRLLLEEVLVRPSGGAHPVVCVGPNAPV